MDGHSESEVLEIINMNSKNCYRFISIFKPATNWSIIYDI